MGATFQLGFLVLFLVANAWPQDDGDGEIAPDAGISFCPSETEENVIYYNTGESSEDSPFEKNLASAYESLLSPSQESPRQAQAGDDPDTVYGYAACFEGNCEDCLATCKNYFTQVAPHAVGARLCLKSGSDACYLRYENYSF
ncbi:hypothetical protein SELMODRAFT_424793 [Selaginella moellendorffii]|uniref:Gnk2-homologous domain-containing protein n=1 Tax=Selaginella moellendorffii TaxID=88036 RepID=D8SR16_SELML|nr:hypothetical protein SELMODRAFT_424793 [Selaginella moellendorffii]